MYKPRWPQAPATKNKQIPTIKRQNAKRINKRVQELFAAGMRVKLAPPKPGQGITHVAVRNAFWWIRY